mmetsp:Transcript_27799/g.32433  ORF Transcript_27799/g.32433 Transcript_27799/m.32433 type:complete len:159 (-) Transcript_27799:104-580(-)
MYSERIWNACEAEFRHWGLMWTERHNSDASMTEQTVLEMSSRRISVSWGLLLSLLLLLALELLLELESELRNCSRRLLQLEMAFEASKGKSDGWCRFGRENKPGLPLLLPLLLVVRCFLERKEVEVELHDVNVDNVKQHVFFREQRTELKCFNLIILL